MPITRLAHVCLKTSDLAATEHFYRELLGFPCLFRFTREGAPYGFYLQVASRQFIEVFAQETVENDSGTQALAHFCLETDDLDSLHAKLLEAGFAPGPIKLGIDATRQFWVRDPVGLNLEFQQYTNRSLQLLGDGTQTLEVDW
jgi:catechol 2,3-dioxygenase-like lactoylglutathione lyase family enzyme